MPMQSTETASICPRCLRRVPAVRVEAGDAVYMEKSCPEHGDLGRTLLWKNDPWRYEEWTRPEAAGKAVAAAECCPLECGLCGSHRQSTCSAILEVTSSCNAQCPICFASSNGHPGSDPDLDAIDGMLQTIKTAQGICPLQISGGEPTLRDDLPAIVALARKRGFDHVQINTNGIRLAADADFASALRDAGTTDFFLQFDGVSDDVYRKIRGTDLLSTKLKTLERCAEAKIGVILVPTLVRHVNDSQIGELIQFGKKWVPVVRGVHFQPMAYLGRYPVAPRNEDRITIPEIIAAIEEQTMGELSVENFVPPG